MPKGREVLQEIFDLKKVPLENIPGESQMQSLFEALLPLTLDLSIKEKALEIFKLFVSLLPPSPRQTNAFHGFLTTHFSPNSACAARVITALHEVVKTPDELVFSWSGLCGAAWVAVYAVHILNLPTYAHGPEADLPINSDYKSACVILDLTTSSKGFRVLKGIEDGEGIIKLLCGDNYKEGSSFGEDLSKEWHFDCARIKLIHLLFPEPLDTQAHQLLSDVVAATSLGLFPSLFRSTSNILHHTGQNFWSSSNSFRTDWRYRVLTILKLFGFDVFFDATEYLTSEEGRFVKRCDEPYPIPPCLQQHGACFSDNHWRSALFALESTNMRMASAFGHVSRCAVILSTMLALTDWADACRKLPIACLYDLGRYTSIEEMLSVKSDPYRESWIVPLIRDLNCMLGLHKMKATSDSACFHLSGMSFLKTYMDYRDQLWRKGIFYRILSGPTKFNDMVVDSVESPYISVDDLQNKDNFAWPFSTPDAVTLYGHGLEPRRPSFEVSLRILAETLVNKVRVQFEFLIDSQRQYLISPKRLFWHLDKCYSPAACDHNPADTTLFSNRLERGSRTYLGDTPWEWDSGKTMAKLRARVTDRLMHVHFTPTYGSPELQWVCCTQAVNTQDHLFVLLTETCTRCFLLESAQQIQPPPAPKGYDEVFNIQVVYMRGVQDNLRGPKSEDPVE